MFKRWHPFVVSVLQEEITKSVAILNVLNYFNIDHSEAIAFGDGENDIDMIELAGLGIAMGNGSDTLKALLILLRRNPVKTELNLPLKILAFYKKAVRLDNLSKRAFSLHKCFRM